MREIQDPDKITSLYGIGNKELLRQKNYIDWISLRHKEGVEFSNKKNDIEFAKDIFTAWDSQRKGYITFQEISEHLISLGLAVEKNFV